MVNQDESYVIDMEFAYFGPFGFDVGKIIANFFLCATAHVHRSPDDTYRDWLLEQVPVIWHTFATEFDTLWANSDGGAMTIDGLLSDADHDTMRKTFMDALLTETVGFAACSMARRTLGIAGVADIRDIEDVEVRAGLEIANLKLSMMLMDSRQQVASIEEVVDIVKNFYANEQL